MNKRLTVYLFSLSLFSSLLSAQEEIHRIVVVRPKLVQRSGWYLGLGASPEFAYRTIITPASYTSDVFPSAPELPKASVSFGFNALYHFSPQLALETGLGYSVKGEKTENYTYTDHRTNISYRRDANYKTRYLEVPLLLHYYFTSGKCAPFIAGGINTAIFAGEKTIFNNTFDNGTYSRTVQHNAETVFYVRGVPYKKESDYYFFNPQAQISIGIDYCGKNYRVRTAPVFKISLLDVNRGPFYERFYSIGWNTIVYLSH